MGVILGPFILFFWFKLFLGNQASIVISYSIYFLIFLLFVFQWIRIFKYKQVLLDNNNILIKSYFTGFLIKVPISDVISLVRPFNLYKRNGMMKTYKMTFMFQEQTHKIYFLKSLDLSNIDDLATYIGVKNNN